MVIEPEDTRHEAKGRSAGEFRKDSRSSNLTSCLT